MAKLLRTYELIPNDGHKSFYKKANVRIYDDGTEVLRSFGTDVMSRDSDGNLHRHWSEWSATTGRHVAAFAGINKAAWSKMKVEKIGDDYSFLRSILCK